mmetsp:Transcript_57688/g.163836  ORF Transcript_57688/g.163836 Transcript_57688/m.163836 type:complete len:203 (+) Transcript_57688:405-1013(+)
MSASDWLSLLVADAVLWLSSRSLLVTSATDPTGLHAPSAAAAPQTGAVKWKSRPISSWLISSLMMRQTPSPKPWFSWFIVVSDEIWMPRHFKPATISRVSTAESSPRTCPPTGCDLAGGAEQPPAAASPAPMPPAAASPGLGSATTGTEPLLGAMQGPAQASAARTSCWPARASPALSMSSSHRMSSHITSNCVAGPGRSTC